MSDDRYGPRWPVLPAGTRVGEGVALPSVLWSQGARRWYIGGGISLIWLISAGTQIIQAARSSPSASAGIVLLCVYGVAFLAATPINWTLAPRNRLLVVAAVFALSFALWPWLGWHVCAVWTYVGVLVATAVVRWQITWTWVLGLSVLALAFDVIDQGWNPDVLWVPAIIASISLMMAAFMRSIVAMNQTRLAQREVERLAAERERGRVARDIHDILGHSLTVITVKSELAGRLVEVDPARAQAEMAEVEALARGALADVRATVAGFRGVSVSSELAAARVALSAADIALEAPSTTDAVPSEHRELAGWVVREGVTNVVRHARARRCRIRLDSRRVSVEDDGVGPTWSASSAAAPGRRESHSPSDSRVAQMLGSGTGLTGLRERVDAAGGTLSIGRSDLGGFRLEVTL